LRVVWDVAGVDEAGRGALAGPVVAAACILRQGVSIVGIDDSKKLTPKQRMRLYKELTSHPGVVYAVGVVDAVVIDKINILQATFQAMVSAVDQLSSPPLKVLVDGNMAPTFRVPAETIIGGDAKDLSIAAASVLAKVTRDMIMDKYHMTLPAYGFNKNKGYGTREHLAAIRECGPSPIHRYSFAPIKPEIQVTRTHV